MYILGGKYGPVFSTDVFKFDCAQGTWSQAMPMPAEKFGFAACTIESDICVFGGHEMGGRT
jgi:hypothetical protein